MISSSSSSSSNVVVLDNTNQLIALNDVIQLSIKLTPSNFPSWRSQFTSILLSYDLLGYVDGTLPCPFPTIIKKEPSEAKETKTTTPQTVPNPAFHHWKRQDQLLLHAILGSTSETVVPFIAYFQTSKQA